MVIVIVAVMLADPVVAVAFARVVPDCVADVFVATVAVVLMYAEPAAEVEV